MARTAKPVATGKSEAVWRQRIVGYGEADPKSLRANPKNWRLHPGAQADALLSVLDRVGWVQNIVVNKRTGNLIDGHLRIELAVKRGETKVPCTYVDLSEEDEAVVLLSLDAMGAMATADTGLLTSLMEELKDNDILTDPLFAKLEDFRLEATVASGGVVDTDSAFRDEDLMDEADTAGQQQCPSCGQKLTPRAKAVLGKRGLAPKAKDTKEAV